LFSIERIERQIPEQLKGEDEGWHVTQTAEEKVKEVSNVPLRSRAIGIYETRILLGLDYHFSGH
jgi:hypothetical protein